MTTHGPEVDAFGGVAGRVLRETMTLRTLATGTALVLVFAPLGYIMTRFGAADGFSMFLQAGIALVLARFAVNGRSGEWSGTVFSTRGGSWLDVVSVTLRYLVLSMAWVLPVLLLGWRPDEIGSAMGNFMMGTGGDNLLSLSSLVAALIALTPPIFLIVSVGATQFRDLIDGSLWRALFSGRLADLFLIYVLYLGALTMTALLFLPFFTAALFQSKGLGAFLALVGLTFGAGMGVSLLGRLCGFFAGLERPQDDWGTAPAPLPAGLGAGPRPTSTVAPRSVTPAPSATATRAVRPAPAAVPASHPAVPMHSVDPEPVAGSSLNPSGKTPLLDARPRMDAAEQRFESDPEGAIQDLEELREHYAPHVLVLHLLTVLQGRMGRTEASMTTALEALPLCLERGATRLAGEIYALHLERANDFKIPRDTILALADDLRRNGDPVSAETVYTRLLERDRGERRAVKGLLQIAEARMEHSDYAGARDVYQLLLMRCPDSPLAVHMEDGLAEAERRLSKAS